MWRKENHKSYKEKETDNYGKEQNVQFIKFSCFKSMLRKDKIFNV